MISADDVRAAHKRREHRLALPVDAIVTPLARDEAAKWGIELVPEEPRKPGGEPSRPAAATSRHVATCDPDDLDRIVDRVRSRIPGADPAVVREIAERVLARIGR